MYPTFDEKDQDILIQRMDKLDQCEGPRVGDFVFFPGEEKPRRFTYDWGEDKIQTTCKGSGGSFYLGMGYVSFSGGLASAILKSKLQPRDGFMEGSVWFFHHNRAGAGRGVNAKVPFRVFDYQP